MSYTYTYTCKTILAICSIFSVMAVYSSLELRLGSLPSLIIFKDGQLNPLFNYSSVDGRNDCSSNKIYFEKQSDMTSIIVMKNETDKFFPVKLYAGSNNTEAFYNYLNDSSNQTVEIYHKCEDSNTRINFPKNISNYNSTNTAEYIDTKESNEYWCKLKLEFSYNDQLYNLEFLKICKEDSKLKTLVTVVLLFLNAVLYTYISTSNEIKLKVLREVREQGEIKWWHGLVFVLMASVLLIIIFYFIHYINIIYTILLTFQSSVCLYISITFFLKKKRTSNIKLLCGVLKKKLYKWQIYKIISASLSLICVYLWFTTRHWVYNNILAFALVFVVLSIFTIKNFKVCVILLICVFVYDSFWVFFSSKIFRENVMVTVATSLNLPIKIEMPLFFSNNPIKKCMLLGLGDIVLPGMIINYCRRFDKLKTHLRGYYYKVAMALYVISLLTAFSAAMIFGAAQPVLFYVCPIFIWGLTFAAYSKGDWYDFWRGKNLTGTQMAVDEIINGEFTKLDNSDSKKNDSLSVTVTHSQVHEQETNNNLNTF